MARTIIYVNLPGDNDHSSGASRGQILVEAQDIEAVKRTLRDKRLGAWGGELSEEPHGDFQLVRVFTVEELEAMDRGEIDRQSLPYRAP